MFNFCPSCASKNITFHEGKVFHCPDCGFTYFHNNAAATGCLIIVPDAEDVGKPDHLRDKWSGKLVFTVRGRDPGKGMLDLPGGFVDAGEGVIEGLYRELREELGWSPLAEPVSPDTDLTQVFKLFASFSNVYRYKGIDYNTCDMYFKVSAPGLKPEDFHLEEDEITGVRFLKPEEINFDEFAFESTKKAVKAYLD
jgi:ADP-ribose pyrophosphatase YjhB (NUDIX family)